MDVEDPDISRCLALLDSSSSPYNFDNPYQYSGQVAYGDFGAESAGRRVKQEDEERVGGEYGYDAQVIASQAIKEERGDDIMDYQNRYNAENNVYERNPYELEDTKPIIPTPRIQLHRPQAIRQPPKTAQMTYPPPPSFNNQCEKQTLPSSVKIESLKYIETPPTAIIPQQSSMAMGKGREVNLDQAIEEFDGVKEALAERDAAMANVIDEPVATADVILARQKTDYPAGFGQSGLVPITALDSAHVPLFNFPTFNRMQSKVFADVYGSDENLVVTAPTSSGKTAIFELAYLRMRKENPGRLAIYMAPTKALCSERSRDWKHRFDKVGTCVEITGDTATIGLDRLLATATLLVITPEKLDVLSRRSSKYTALDNIRLVMIDEVHILGESRGATLEVVMSRLKKRCTSYEPIRFVAVSATVPNIKDVAKWLAPPRSQASTGIFINGNNEEVVTQQVEDRVKLTTMPEAKLWQFGDDYRPVPLSKLVQGFDGNDWTLGKKLDQELIPLILEQGAGKPILVFCPTRRACQSTAAFLHDKFQEISKFSGVKKLPWPRSRSTANFNDPQLQLWWTSGIAVHHAGIENNDRRAIEDGYKSGAISVICCTSTLAVGVNLPAHLVIIKGTQTWAGAANGLREYSDVDIQQMMGRAGRPQYDTSGTVIIMCEKSKVSMYRQKIFSQTVLESCLHSNLSEHINSEVGLGTISSLKGAQEWLEGSFLWIRIQQNPRAYTSINKAMKGDNESWDKVLEKYVKLGLQQLRNIELVTHRGWNEEVKNAGSMPDDDPMEELTHTALGKVMSECCIQLGTMESIVELGPEADLQDCLETLSGACEFEDLRVRQGEAGFLNGLRASPEIRFPLVDPCKTYADKVFLLLQGRFAAIEWDSVSTGKTKTENSSAQQTLFSIYQSAPRIAQARVLTTRNYGAASKAGLQLLRVVNGKAWEDQSSVFQQLRNIGPKSMKVLGANNILTWDDLLKTPPHQLEHWLARNPPFGSNLIREALAKDRYEVAINQHAPATLDQDGFPHVTFTINLKNEKKGVDEKDISKWTRRANLSILTVRSDSAWIDYRRALAKKMLKTEFELSTVLTAEEQTVEIQAGIDESSGLTTTAILRPDLSKLGEIDYEACEQRRNRRVKKEEEERLRAAQEEDGITPSERDLDAEEMKKRDKSVRNKKVRAEDFRKEAAYEGGWTKPQLMPKRSEVPKEKAGMRERESARADEAMEDNAFDDGEGNNRSEVSQVRGFQRDSGPKHSQTVRSKRSTTTSIYIDDEAEESDDEHGNGGRRSRSPSNISDLIDDGEDLSDTDIDEPTIKSRKKRSRTTLDDSIDIDDPPKRSNKKYANSSTSRNKNKRQDPVIDMVDEPEVESQDSLIMGRNQRFAPSFRAETRAPEPQSASQLILPPVIAQQQPVETSAELPENWYDETDLSAFIIESTPPRDTEPSKSTQTGTYDNSRSVDRYESDKAQQYQHIEDQPALQLSSKGRVRFASTDEVQVVQEYLTPEEEQYEPIQQVMKSQGMYEMEIGEQYQGKEGEVQQYENHQEYDNFPQPTQYAYDDQYAPQENGQQVFYDNYQDDSHQQQYDYQGDEFAEEQQYPMQQQQDYIPALPDIPNMTLSEQNELEFEQFIAENFIIED